MITYRNATESDLLEIVHLMKDDILGKDIENVSDLSNYQKAFHEIQNSPDNELIIMLKDGEIIGTFQLTITPYLVLNGTKRATIESVLIHSSFRGNGYGSQMMQYAISLAKEKGAKLVQLTKNKKRIDAKRFYEKLGFVASHEGMKFYII
jgi:GNAT superfamily N-acetyltransferase